MLSEFQQTNDFESRQAQALRMRAKYPDRIPVICEKAPKSTIPDIDKNKFLLPTDITIGQFSYVIRKRVKLAAETGIFLLVNNVFPATSSSLADLYNEHKADDGFLYITYSGENTFG